MRAIKAYKGLGIVALSVTYLSIVLVGHGMPGIFVLKGFGGPELNQKQLGNLLASPVIHLNHSKNFSEKFITYSIFDQSAYINMQYDAPKCA